MYKAVIFDMDGLMFDTERLSYQGYLAVGKQMNLPVTEELYRSLIGCNAKANNERLHKAFGDYDEKGFHSLFMQFINESFSSEGIPIKKGLLVLLDYLTRRGIKKAVATSTSTHSATIMLKKAGVYDKFDGFVFGDQITRSKPDPDIFLKAIEVLGVSADQAVILEDSHNGVRAATAAGIDVVMVPDMLEPIPELHPTAVVEDLLKVMDYLESK